MLCELDSLPLELEEMEQIDYGTFVSIDSQDFRRIVLELDVHSGDTLFLEIFYINFLKEHVSLNFVVVCNSSCFLNGFTSQVRCFKKGDCSYQRGMMSLL